VVRKKSQLEKERVASGRMVREIVALGLGRPARPVALKEGGQLVPRRHEVKNGGGQTPRKGFDFKGASNSWGREIWRCLERRGPFGGVR